MRVSISAAEPSDLGRMRQRGTATVVWKTVFQTKKQNYRTWLRSLHIPGFAFAYPSCHFADHYYLQTQELVLQKHFSPECRVHMITNPRHGWRHRWDAAEACWLSLLGGQSNKGGHCISLAHPISTDRGCNANSVWLFGTALGFHGFGVPSHTLFPCMVSPR